MIRQLLILALLAAATGTLIWRADTMADAGHGRSHITAASPAARVADCVEPTGYMRRHHMDLLRHQRIRTVQTGERGTHHNLADCIACHASVEHGQPVPIDRADQFCGACHAYVAIAPDCFGCHSPVPRALEDRTASGETQ